MAVTTLMRMAISSIQAMKKFSSLFVSVAAAAMALVSCQVEDSVIDNPSEEAVTIRVHASANELKSDDPATKTYIDNTNTILWGTGEYMKLALTAGETTTFANSTDASANTFDGQPSATFEFSVTPESASEYVYQGLYPASAASTISNTNAANYKVNLPAIQNATASSYDPAAYIMVAKPETFTSVQTDWVASFRRGTALNKITLKNVPSGVSFKRVKITAEGKKLAGGRHFDLTAGEGTDVYGNESTIEVHFATPLTGSNVDVWFTSWNVEIAESETLTIVAYTTDKKSYTKAITVPAGRTIKFQEGYLNTLGANLSGIDPADVTEFEAGDYVVLAKSGSDYFALKAEKEAGKERLLSVEYTGNLDSYYGDAELIWTITKSSDSFIFENDSKYLGYKGSDNESYWLEADANWTENNYLLDVTPQETAGQYYVTLHSDGSRYLSKNSSGSFFAFYGNTTQKADIVFVPATVDTRTPVTLSFAEDAINKTTANYSEFTGQTATANPSVSGITYAIEGDNIGTITAATGAVALNGNTGSATVTATFAGDATYRPASASYTITVVDAPAGAYYEKLTDVSEVVSGEYVIAAYVNSKYYAMSNTFATKISGTEIIVTDNKISESSASGYNVTFTLNGEGKVAISNGTDYLNCVASGTNFSISNTATYHTIAQATYGSFRISNTRGLIFNGTQFGNYAVSNVNGSTYWDIELFKKIDTRAEAGMSWSSENVNASIEDGDIIQFTAPTLSNPNGVSGITYESTETSVATVSSEGAVTIIAAGTTTIKAIFAGDTDYKPQTVSYTLTVADNRTPVVNYDFQTVAELNAIVTSTSAEYSGYLTDAVVSFVPATNTAIVKDATGSVMFYKSGHGLKQGQTYTGAIAVTAIKYNSLYSEITVWDASFTGSETVVAPEIISLANLIGHYDAYQNAYVQVAGLTVSSVDGKNINVTDGANDYVVYDNTSSVSVAAGDVITAVGTVTKYQTTEEIKVWKAADIIVTASAPKAITFTQPAAGGSFTVKVDGNTITSGTTVAAGKTVTLTATAASGYNFTSWNVTGASVVDASSASTSFEMGSSPVSVSATFTQIGSTTHYYVKVTSATSITDGDYLIVYESGNVAFNGGLSSFDAIGNTIEVNITSNGIEATSAVNAAKFTINSMSGGYSIMGASGKYITVNSYNNGLVTSASAAANGISFDANGNALITVSTSGGTMTLKYNSASNQTRFRYYKSGQQDIQLYKLN